MYELSKDIVSKIIDFEDYGAILSDKFAWDIVDIPEVMQYFNNNYPDSIIIGAYVYNMSDKNIIFRGDIWTNRIYGSKDEHADSFRQLTEYLEKYSINFMHEPDRILVHMSFKDHNIDYISSEKKLKEYEEETALASGNGWELPDKPAPRTK